MQSNAETQTGTELKTAKPARRFDIDWLRVLTVLLLFPFHAARVFDNWGPWYVKNAALSDALTYFNNLVYPSFTKDSTVRVYCCGTYQPARFTCILFTHPSLCS
jgi:hypothetical protein